MKYFLCLFILGKLMQGLHLAQKKKKELNENGLL